MKQRGRKPITELPAISVNGKPSRLQPPDNLDATERQRFIAIVAHCDPAHFQPTDLPLLLRYIEADILAAQAAAEMKKNGAILKNGRPNPWLTVQEKSVKTLTALSMRLRLSPQARIDRKALHRQQLTRPSAYDMMAAEDWQ